MVVWRYLLVLDMDLLAVEEQCELGPISYLAARQEHEQCEASGLVSDEDLVNAVRSETRARDYDGVILAVGRLGGSGLARAVHLDPVHQLRRRWGKRLIVCQPGQPRHNRG